jgi:large subunit ribosomal protein L22
MTTHKYAYTGKTAHTAKAVGRDLPVSTKQAVEICKHLRGKDAARAKKLLQQVQEKSHAIPFTRASEGAGHKRGVGPGKYPVKAAGEFLKLLTAVEANAQQAGLFSQMRIIHLCAHRASRPMRYGRHRGREMKRTHVEIVVQEIPGKKRAPPVKKQETPKAEAKPAAQVEPQTAKSAPAAKPGAQPTKPPADPAAHKETAKKTAKPAPKKATPTKAAKQPAAQKAGKKAHTKVPSAHELKRRKETRA